MIVFPSEWPQHVGEHLVTAYPSGGGRYRCFERLRPPPDFAAIVAWILSSDRTFKVSQVEETIKLVTREGEYGAWVRLYGLRGNEAEQRYIGAIFAEDFAVALDTLAPAPALFDELAAGSQRFLHGATLGLGLRRRLFLYSPPPGWQSLPRGLCASWYPPNYPRNRTHIIVQPALPVAATAEELIAEQLREAGAGLHRAESTRAPFVSATGLAGSYFRLVGTRVGGSEQVFRDLAVFVDAQHVYVFRLETTSPERLPEARASFTAVAASFRPLPTSDERQTGRAFAAGTPSIEHPAR